MIRRIKRKFGISAPRLSVRPHVPWYVRWAITLPFLLVSAGLIWWAYDSGLEFAGFHRGQAEKELSQLRELVTNLKIENSKLASQSATFERQAQVEHAANQETGKQIKLLNEENARIQEDLAFFQSMTFSGKREAELSIQRLKVEHDALPGEFRFRLLLVQSASQRSKDFHGNLQLLVNTRQNGKKSLIVFPQTSATDGSAYLLNFKYYQRVEHSFQLPPDALVDSIQVRIFEHGIAEPKIQQNVSLS
jgi:hypothetical protein